MTSPMNRFIIERNSIKVCIGFSDEIPIYWKNYEENSKEGYE
jgi:hypothetical protein